MKRSLHLKLAIFSIIASLSLTIISYLLIINNEFQIVGGLSFIVCFLLFFLFMDANQNGVKLFHLYFGAQGEIFLIIMWLWTKALFFQPLFFCCLSGIFMLFGINKVRLKEIKESSEKLKTEKEKLAFNLKKAKEIIYVWIVIAIYFIFIKIFMHYAPFP